jgi:protein-tyrosine phosphatase
MASELDGYSGRPFLLGFPMRSRTIEFVVNCAVPSHPMVDIHCHILPDVDDGSKSWEMTAEMCRVAVRDDITHIVATPHCNGEFEYDRERYTAMLGRLHDAGNGKLKFSLGCDFHFSYDNIQDALAHPRRYTIGESQYLLVEFSDYGIPAGVHQNLLSLSSCGMVPIITHPERNSILLRKPEMVLEFAEQGCLVQVTANSFTGFWGGQAKNMAEWLLKCEAVHVVASDAHDFARRKPTLSEAHAQIAELAGKGTADALVSNNPAAIVAGKSLPKRCGSGTRSSG